MVKYCVVDDVDIIKIKTPINENSPRLKLFNNFNDAKNCLIKSFTDDVNILEIKLAGSKCNLKRLEKLKEEDL